MARLISLKKYSTNKVKTYAGFFFSNQCATQIKIWIRLNAGPSKMAKRAEKCDVVI
jgi:hypothetical protein